jgi:cytochrome P450
MSWACYLLAIDPARQSTLRSELRKSLGPAAISGRGSDTDIAGILEKLPFLNGVISETLRLTRLSLLPGGLLSATVL